MTKKTDIEKKKVTNYFLYDADQPQNIPFKWEVNGYEYSVAHKLKPLSDDRFFEYAKAEAEWRKKYTGEQSTSLKEETQKFNLWLDLVLERKNFPQRDDWKTITPDEQKITVIDLLLEVSPTSMESKESFDEVPDEDAPLEVEFYCQYGGIDLKVWKELIETDSLPEWLLHSERSRIISLVKMNKYPRLNLTLAHHFRRLTQAEKDEIQAVLQNKPSPQKLASLARDDKSPTERLCDIWDDTQVRSDGYAEGTRIPAYHKAATILIHFVRERTRAKKS